MNQDPDPELSLRGRLARSLGTMREMLPGSFVERGRKCGKPTCRCANGKDLHTQFLLSVFSGGKTKTYNVPAEMAEEVQRKVQIRKDLEAIVEQICQINLRRFLRRTGKRAK
jgi:hypothetical protein